MHYKWVDFLRREGKLDLRKRERKVRRELHVEIQTKYLTMGLVGIAKSLQD